MPFKRRGEYFLLNDETADMDVNLVDNMEAQDAPGPSAPPGDGCPSTLGPRSPSETQAAIMMYSNEAEGAGFEIGFHRQQSWTSHYLHMERDENIKCVVTSVLILAIIVAILVVIFIRNPEM